MAISHRSLSIILATVIPGTALLLLTTYIIYRVRRHKTAIFKRGITPIEDEEIESWRAADQDEDDDDEKRQKPPATSDSEASVLQTSHGHRPTKSMSSIQKPASVIVYQTSRPSVEEYPGHKHSSSSGGAGEVSVPMTSVLARAPNARPGLTDDAIQGDVAFIPQLKRQPSRLAKQQPASRSNSLHNKDHNRSTSLRSTASRDHWHGHNGSAEKQISPRPSAESFPRATSQGKHKRIYSSSSIPPRMSLDDDMSPGGLSPRPVVRQSEIGRAIG